MKSAATTLDRFRTASPVQERRSPPQSQVGLKAPRPPEPIEDAPDFIEFLCDRFSLDRDTGTELLSELVLNYEPKGTYSINTLDQPVEAEEIAS